MLSRIGIAIAEESDLPAGVVESGLLVIASAGEQRGCRAAGGLDRKHAVGAAVFAGGTVYQPAPILRKTVFQHILKTGFAAAIQIAQHQGRAFGLLLGLLLCCLLLIALWGCRGWRYCAVCRRAVRHFRHFFQQIRQVAPGFFGQLIGFHRSGINHCAAGEVQDAQRIFRHLFRFCLRQLGLSNRRFGGLDQEGGMTGIVAEGRRDPAGKFVACLFGRTANLQMGIPVLRSVGEQHPLAVRRDRLLVDTVPDLVSIVIQGFLTLGMQVDGKRSQQQ